MTKEALQSSEYKNNQLTVTWSY